MGSQVRIRGHVWPGSKGGAEFRVRTADRRDTEGEWDDAQLSRGRYTRSSTEILMASEGQRGIACSVDAHSVQFLRSTVLNCLQRYRN
jgi:hypothetical protein